MSETKFFSDDELIYAARDRCPCGAGLAYPKGIGRNGYWDCSDILTGRAKPKDDPESVDHTPQLPFTFYEIKSELQPSQGFDTTRPTVFDPRVDHLRFYNPKREAPYGYECPTCHGRIARQWRDNPWACNGCGVLLTAFVRPSARAATTEGGTTT